MGAAARGDLPVVEWRWIPAAFGVAILGGALVMLLANPGSLFRYLRIGSR
jgi:hypothetical protein